MKDRNEIRELVLQAKSFRMQVSGQSGNESSLNADELLLFLYRLRDGYRIVRSKDDRRRNSSFTFLQDLLYQLESRPEETLKSAEWRKQIESLLTDLIDGSLTVAKLN